MASPWIGTACRTVSSKRTNRCSTVPIAGSCGHRQAGVFGAVPSGSQPRPARRPLPVHAFSEHGAQAKGPARSHRGRTESGRRLEQVWFRLNRSTCSMPLFCRVSEASGQAQPENRLPLVLKTRSTGAQASFGLFVRRICVQCRPVSRQISILFRELRLTYARGRSRTQLSRDRFISLVGDCAPTG